MERRSTLPRRCQRSTIDHEGLNCRIRNGNGCFPLCMGTPKIGDSVIEVSKPKSNFLRQADRQISIPKLKPLRVLHLEPINLVVFKVSDWDIFS